MPCPLGQPPQLGARGALLLPMQLSLLARHHGLGSSHAALRACKARAWRELSWGTPPVAQPQPLRPPPPPPPQQQQQQGLPQLPTAPPQTAQQQAQQHGPPQPLPRQQEASQGVPRHVSDPYSLCLALTSLEPNARRQCALLHRGALVCAGQCASALQHGQQQQQASGHDVGEANLCARAASACILDLILRLLGTSCGAGNAHAAVQVLAQLRQAYLQGALQPQLPHPDPHSSSAAQPPAGAAATQGAGEAPHAPLPTPPMQLLPPPLPLQQQQQQQGQLTEPCMASTATQVLPHSCAPAAQPPSISAAATLARVLAACPGPASLLWVCAAHLVHASELPLEVTRRLGYAQLPVAVHFDCDPVRHRPAQAHAPPKAPATACPDAGPAGPSCPTSPATTDPTWTYLELALACACRAVEGATHVGALEEDGRGVAARPVLETKRQEPMEQQQLQQQAQPELPETGVAAAAHLAAAVRSAGSYQQVLLRGRPPTSAPGAHRLQQQQAPQTPVPSAHEQQQLQQAQQHAPPHSTPSLQLPLVSWWLAQPDHPACAARLAALPHQARAWLGPKYASALSAALHAAGLPPAPAVQLPQQPPQQQQQQQQQQPSGPGPQLALPSLAASDPRHAALLLSGVYLSAGLAVAAVSLSAAGGARGGRGAPAARGPAARAPPVAVFDLLGLAADAFAEVR